MNLFTDPLVVAWAGVVIALASASFTGLVAFIRWDWYKHQKAAQLSASWFTHQRGGRRHLVIKNSGPSAAQILNVRELAAGNALMDMKYAVMRDIFPRDLPAGERFEIQLEHNQVPERVLVEWTDRRRGTQSRTLSVSSSFQTS